MKKRLPILAVITALVLGVSATAYGFDCIRVSASARGLASSVKSGNWLPFFLGSGAEVKQTLADNFGVAVTDAEAACIAAEYATSGAPRYFALGIGVAGPNGVLAGHNKNTRVLSDNHGIDHFEESPILGALIGAFGACGVPVPE
jgi:hypothetical protein